MTALAADFYDRPVLEVAPDLIGCVVRHGDTSAVIVETEAYHESEPACHAYAGLTRRTETLFGEPGRAYVYRSYGVHALLNAVCEPEGVGAAVLIRALAPVVGIDAMRARRGFSGDRGRGARAARGARSVPGSGSRKAGWREQDLCSGPGKLTQALGVRLTENGSRLSSGPVRIRARAGAWRDPSVVEGTRIGITRAIELRWRFCVVGDRNVSRPRP